MLDPHRRRRILGRQRQRTEPLPGLGLKRFEPQPLGSLVGHIKVRSVSAVAFAHADGLPAAGLITRPRVGFRIGETLGQKRRVAEALAPLRA